MPRKDTTYLRPTGWENPKDEWRRLCPMDYGTYSWENWILIFQISDESDKPSFLQKFQRGIEATLGQCRHVAGSIEKNEFGDYSVVTRPDSTVRFATLWLDGPDDECLSYSEWESESFCCEALIQDPSRLVVFPRSSDASPATIQPTMAFQLTFIPGGAIFGISIHHWFMDAIGIAGFIHQLAANCRALENGTERPFFDETLMDRSRFMGSPVPEKDKINISPPPLVNRKRLPCAYLLFHLPLSKARELKRMATPEDGSMISTYDAVVAFLWRIMMKNRAQIYNPRLRTKAIFGEAVNMRGRVDPPVPHGYQGVFAGGTISLFQKRPLTLGQVISEVPLSRVASFIRAITNSADSAMLEKQVDKNRRARDKLALHKTLDFLPPMSLVSTDWRGTDVSQLDFGFGRSVALRSPADAVVGNLMILYPHRKVKDDPDHGWEIVLPFEAEHVDMLINDPELNEFLQYCGYEAHAQLTPRNLADMD
ncbi:transferase [Corynascus similis CBS 632.67]